VIYRFINHHAREKRYVGITTIEYILRGSDNCDRLLCFMTHNRATVNKHYIAAGLLRKSIGFFITDNVIVLSIITL
jgi:hypothetical protein